MTTGDWKPPPGWVWSDAHGWVHLADAEIDRLTAALAAKDAELVEWKRRAGKYVAGCELCDEREAEMAKMRDALEEIRLMTDTDHGAAIIAELALTAGEGT